MIKKRFKLKELLIYFIKNFNRRGGDKEGGSLKGGGGGIFNSSKVKFYYLVEEKFIGDMESILLPFAFCGTKVK